MRYYVDTCVWLNILKKEKRFFSSSISFLECKIDENIVISTIVLKELTYKLDRSSSVIRRMLEQYIFGITILSCIQQDYDYARVIEKENNYLIGFLDCLHIALSRRSGSILVTRDKDLICVGKKYVVVKKPEDIL